VYDKPEPCNVTAFEYINSKHNLYFDYKCQRLMPGEWIHNEPGWPFAREGEKN